nr:receptor-like protein kinase 5 [Ziziphus jujuba var. spinosa]
MAKTTTAQICLQLPLCALVFLFIILGHADSQSLQDEEQAVLLRIKQYWGNPPLLSRWSTASNSPHCSWTGIHCTDGSVTALSLFTFNIEGKFPPFICDLKNLTNLVLGNNSIADEFPRAIYNCSKLEQLDLSLNYFIGTVPSDLYRLDKLTHLDLSGNNFSGEIPATIGQMQQLTYLKLTNNLFNGSFPPEISNLSNLEMLGLGFMSNFKPSRLPSNYTQLKKLKYLWIPQSNMIGEIPESIGDMVSLNEVDLSTNGLSGKIPSSLFMLKNLSILYLHVNQLSREIPQVVKAVNLRVLDLSQNNLTGPIPEDFGKLTKLTGLSLFTNQFSGAIPESVGRLPSLMDLKLFDNNLSGTLPPDFGRYSPLREFQVAMNRLTGKLPENLCYGRNLIGVVAFDNDLTGELPESLGNCSALLTVSVKNNRLSGNIPSGLWTSTNMSIFTLSNNSFTGELPEKLSLKLSRLEINDNKFSGKIPVGVSSWKSLVVFKANNNLLTGSIPQELTTLSGLTTLFLHHNKLTGSLPSDIVSWKSLNTLNLAQNQLSGPLPKKLGSLPSLTDLDLSENQFSGQIPSEFGHLRLNILNLSSNHLSGVIPREFENPAYSNSFLNNPGLCAGSGSVNLRNCNFNPTKSNKISVQSLALIVASVVAAILLASCILLFVIRGYKKKHGLGAKWKITSFQRLNFTESKIRSGLTESNLIGSGGSGKVYRVPVNRIGDVVAVKKIWNKRKLDERLEKEFNAEVKILSSIRHSNVVKLMCCLSSENSKLLVYEYLENRSLDQWLHSKNRPPAISAGFGTVQNVVLDWPKRMQIAIGAAQGLCYMHHDCVPPIVHRDIKLSNILLDSDFNAKIADFGLAKLLIRQGEPATMSTVAGSFGYMAPEYAQSTRVNEKIDVYSFGVVLLELATGRQANQGDEHTSLAEWAWRHVQEGNDIVEAFDEEVKEPCYLEEMRSVFKLGIICTGTLPSTRPSMKEVVHILLRCGNQLAYGQKIVWNEYDFAPLLKNSKRERGLEEDNHSSLATIV